ncbi:hypothetical protein D3C87_1633070 [compost metagenome]
MHAGFEASIHDRQILVGQRHVDEHFGLETLDKQHGFGHDVGIHLSGLDLYPVHFLDFGCYFITFRLGAAGEHYFGENIAVQCAFVCHNTTDTSCANDKNLGHFNSFKFPAKIGRPVNFSI